MKILLQEKPLDHKYEKILDQICYGFDLEFKLKQILIGQNLTKAKK